MPHAPCPVPTHMVTAPYFWFLLFISFNSWTVNLAPVHPKGCPKAIAPPFTLTILGSTSNSLIMATDWEANASFNSICARSFSFYPAAFNASGMA